MSSPQETTIINKIFKFKIGDLVLIALREHPIAKIREKQKYKKPSISGHFDKETGGVFKILWRTFTISATFYLTCFYRLKYKNGPVLQRLYHEDMLRSYSP